MSISIENDRTSDLNNQQNSSYEKHQWTIDDFEVGPSLGKGKFSEVFIAREKKSGFLIALKIMQKQFLKSYGLEEQIKKEILLQNVCEHENILQMYGFFHDKNNIYLIIEFAEQGDLYTLTHQFPDERMPEYVAAAFIKQVINALQYLHLRGIIHRDLKPENILISKGLVKLGDFGLATYLGTAPNEKRKTFCGTLDYISPEMFNRRGHDFKIDIWSIGILIFEICAGNPPFESENYNETMKKVCQLQIKYPQHFSADLKDILSKILVKNAEQRPSFQQILEHKWFQIKKE